MITLCGCGLSAGDTTLALGVAGGAAAAGGGGGGGSGGGFAPAGPLAAPINPDPPDGATDVLRTAQLSWWSSFGATGYSVYFGISSPGVFQGNQSGIAYNPGFLEAWTTYYWRIDAYNDNESATGQVWSFQTGREWMQVVTGNAPLPRGGHAMAYDSNRNKVVLFGGYDGVTCLDETWEYDSSGWVQRFPANKPLPRLEPAMAFDSLNNVTVLFGGLLEAGNDNPQYFSNETWLWDGSDWQQAYPANSPSARWGAAMVYDDDRNVAVLFGGWITYGSYDTWEWDGADWTFRTNSGPTGRVDHVMAFDSVRNLTVLHGGDTGGALSFETWEWNGSSWTERFPSYTPMRRYDHAMAYDSFFNKTIMFGGWIQDRWADGTWEWDGLLWKDLVSPVNPSARSWHAMVYDSARRRIVLFGGDMEFGLDGETWEY
jgi:hypothetical protein